ncbi:permease [Clostridium chromiireducens]|uniref:Permease n=1 Tax=Clostridium chromiireducens TaxID=225345 RepID=A0A964W3C8_9CLOT|nr:permease [Clostridium chromiireducens]MVX65018.1 permease [Clostridium chromiireducens]
MVELTYLAIIIIFSVYLYINDKDKLKVAGVGFGKVTSSLTPYVFGIILIASIIQVCIPKELIVSLLGKDSGLIAPILAAVFGSVFEGPTIIAFVLGASLLVSGASIAAVGAFISSFSMVGLVAIPLEKKELGITFTVVRFVITLSASILIGYLIGVII